MKKFIILFSIISAIYLGLRLNHFSENMTFHLDQGLHLLESRQMLIDKKIRLIGPMVSSKTFLDRGFFIGPYYYYILAVLGIIFQWNPLIISLFLFGAEYIFVGWFAFWIYKKFGIIESLGVFILITFSNYFIIHSRFIWNPHFLLPLGIAGVITLEALARTKKNQYLIIFSLLWGIAFSFHYSAVFWIIPLAIVMWFIRKTIKWFQLLVIPLFFIAGDLPYFIFEVKHNFYNLRTLLWVMANSHSGGKIEPHYFIYPLVIFALVGLVTILRKSTDLRKIIIFAVLIISLSSWQLVAIKDPIPLGHPVGWSYPLELQIRDMILKNGCPKNFNIASTVSGDTRSYDLRFLLTAKECPPMGVEDYPKAETLYLVAPISRPPEKESVWEVSSLGKTKIKLMATFEKRFNLYRLDKNNGAKTSENN